MPDLQYSITASTDDICVHDTYGAWACETNNVRWAAGRWDALDTGYGSGGRWLGIAIPPGSTIVSAKLRIRARNSDTYDPVYSKIRGEKNVSPATFSNCADYWARTYTDAVVFWDNIGNWSAGSWYYSPEIKTIIQEIIDLPGWSNGNNIVLFWDDHDKRSGSDQRIRRGRSFEFDGVGSSPRLYITYSAPTTSTSTSSTSTSTTSTSTTISTSTSSSTTISTSCSTSTSTSTSTSSSTSTSTTSTSTTTSISTSISTSTTSTSSSTSSSTSTTTTLARYRLASEWEDLKVDKYPLLTVPHPAFFAEGEIIGESETGYPIELGKSRARWEYENQILSAAAWDQLQDFLQDSGFGEIYIRTRVNTIEGGKFSYENFKGFMKKPEGELAPPWRYREVMIEFFDLETWTDEKEAIL